MGTISAVLITRNEEDKIETCLRALSWADEIVLVDSESRDQTAELASKYTDKIHTRAFDDFARQKNYGISLAKGDWILSIDADEVVNPDLREAMQAVARQGSPHNGFRLRRTNILFGRALRHGGQNQERILRFFRKGKARFEQPIHEKLVLEGSAGELPGELMHFSSLRLNDYLKKLDLYTHLESEWLDGRGVYPSVFDLWFKPWLRFAYFYGIRLGFLDGYEGLLYHTLSSFYCFLKYARLKERQRGRHPKK
ncbi:MAG: glycosyltransferase family 2 protein [Candidatus Omnitrophica bacterium]|nr:glycosyltransferase family 2 protein [Candidatus Omnitrophota bacterium]